MQKSDDYIIKLISCKLAGEATETELQELQTIINEFPVWAQMVRVLEQNHLSALTESDEAAADAALAAHSVKMQFNTIYSNQSTPLTISRNKPGTPGKLIKWMAGMAAAALLFMGVRHYYFQNDDAALTGQPANEIVTSKGAKTAIRLSDGTQIWLNADSKLTYDKNFSEDLREVTLSGEAFFDVAHNPARPFVIHTQKMDIKVLGTTFNVKSYDGDATAEASLLKGKIEVTFKDRSAEKIILRPHEKIILRKEDKQPANSASRNDLRIQVQDWMPHVQDSLLLVETAWMQNKIAFENESLQNIAAMMERKFNAEIIFHDASVRELRFTGIFETENLEKIFEILSLTRQFKYRVEGNRIIIFKK